MKCEDCPFSMVCHAGRLGGERAAGVSLCPKCEKLEVLGERKQIGDDEDEVLFEVYRLKCELRVVTRDMHRKWFESRIQNSPGKHALNDKMIVDAIAIDDPGPGLHHDSKLIVKSCLLCDRAPILNRMNVRYIDLDDKREFEKGRLAHLFSLKTSRSSGDL
jgi:hypothetical protein